MPIRVVTLVLVDRAASIRGSVGPFTFDVPWWQESGPIADALPGAVVLRLLDADPERADEMGGPVTYLVEFDGDIPAPLVLRPWTGRDVTADHPLRAPWARPGGPADDIRWVETHAEIDRTRSPRQHRTWNLSAIWSVPVLARGNPVTVWLKCLPPFFAHEPAVLSIMADQMVPEVIATGRHRLLLVEMAGHDGHDPSPAEEVAMVDALIDIQLASVDRVDQLLAAGVPDMRTPRLLDEAIALIRRLVPDDTILRAFITELPDRLAEVDAAGLPTVLAHGDPHGGNCRLGRTPPLWFDWGDSLIGNPLLDVAALHRMSESTVNHWLDRWAAEVPGADPHRVWRLLEPVARLRMAWVYQRFCDNIEPDERRYHQRDVMRSLEEVRQSLIDRPGSRRGTDG